MISLLSNQYYNRSSFHREKFSLLYLFFRLLRTHRFLRLSLIHIFIQPDQGQLEIGETIKIGYLAQEEPNFDTNQRVIDYVKDIAEYVQTREGLSLIHICHASGTSVLRWLLFLYLFIHKINKGDDIMSEKYRDGALYIRVSTDKQEELSPDAQKRLLLDYAKKNKILVNPDYIFIENGISGRKAQKLSLIHISLVVLR